MSELINDIEQDEDELEPIEAYCVKCKEKTEMEDPQPVWTSRGQPATRVCPDCGTIIFRIGKTDAHRTMSAPPPIRVEDTEKLVANRGRKKPLPATYINVGKAESDFGAKLAKELDQAGVHTWYDPNNATEEVQWAGGVHPALRDCVKMVVVLSGQSQDSESVAKAWNFFKKEKKPIVVALLDTVEVPDALRRNPRFDFSKDYKAAFRQLLQALSES
jgi:NAD-dependent SIR2 family protein deacetylase